MEAVVGRREPKAQQPAGVMKRRLGHRPLMGRHRNAPIFDLIVEPHFSISPSRMATLRPENRSRSESLQKPEK